MTLLSIFKVSGHSMQPSFKEGQKLIVSSIPYFLREPKVGDVIIIRDPSDGRLLLKRINEVRLRKQYLVAGDNPGDSRDSRTFGAIERKNILGKVILNLTKR